MKRILSLALAMAMGFTACQQYTPAPTVYKSMTGEKSVALRRTSVLLGMHGEVMPTLNDKMMMSIKNELRKKGWKITLDGVTGRAGETQSINSGADYTMLYNCRVDVNVQGVFNIALIGIPVWILRGCPECLRYFVDISVVENKTGEEVVVLQGVSDDRERTARELVEEMDRYTTRPAR